ncbi:MAG TPA: FGGY family carbohydrate kinase [Streptosporangiaceae bacterium]|nr:FGGY family carbohydrate kinase [Streptosporangiaceae bacterium]
MTVQDRSAGGHLVVGVDSSTQSCKVVLCRADDGTVIGRGSAPHPPGTEADPAAWWAALLQAGDGLLERADAVGVAGQQHGMIVLDSGGEVVRPALLWNDLRSAPAAAELVAEFGGPQWWASHVGSVPTASFTVTKLRWLARHEPSSAARAASVLLPHDWLTWRLCGGPGTSARPATDRGDASGTGYFSTASGDWRPDLAEAAIGHPLELPRVAGPAEVVGQTAWGAAVSAGTGDNMGAALGLALGPGDLAVSIGTSGTAFAVSHVPAADPSGAVAGFADATGRFLPLVCTVNAGLVLSAAASLAGTDLDGLSALALAAEPGAGGITLLPYLDGERTPDRPGATGVLRGLTTRNATRENLARAAAEAVLASLADAADLLAGQGAGGQAAAAPEAADRDPPPRRERRVLLIGGGARSAAVCALAPGLFFSPVLVPEPEEYVALGAARQAAWALARTPEPPAWPRRPAATYTGAAQPEIRERHAALRDDTATWKESARP